MAKHTEHAPGILFALKRTAILVWENLGLLLVLNLVGSILAAACVVLYLAAGGGNPSPGGPLLLTAGMAGFSVWAGIAYGTAFRFTPAYRINRGLVGGYGKRTIVSSLFTFFVILFVVLSLRLLVPFYLSLGTLPSFCAAVFLMLVTLLLPALTAYVLPSYWKLQIGFPRAIRTGISLLFNDPVFSISLSVLWWLILVVSSLTAFLFPGFIGMTLLNISGFRVLFLKHEYRESHPDAFLRGIPWEEILAAENEALGERTLKSIFFPWKGK